jgi:hypothetical protein
MSEITVGCIGLLAMLVIFFTGLEMALGMTLVGFVGVIYMRGLMPAVNMLAKDILTLLHHILSR